MGWTWQGKTYQTRAALDRAKRRHYEGTSANYHADHLAKLRQGEKTRQKYYQKHLASLRHDEEMRRKYAAVSEKYRRLSGSYGA